MKLARVLAHYTGKPVTAPSNIAARRLTSDGQRSEHRTTCIGRTASDSASSTGREECWSCGVCYEHVCCPFTLPCGHTVCGSCLEQLLMRQASCPFCRVSVFQGCVFGRNVSMWNVIQARHPKEAAQLSDTHAVIRYDPSSSLQPPEQHQHPHHATQSHPESTPLTGGDHLSTFAATYIEPVLPIVRSPEAGGTAAAAAAPHSTRAGQSIFSRLAGLALLAPRPPQPEAAVPPFHSSSATAFTSSAENPSADAPLPSSAMMSLPMNPAGYRLATRATVRSTDRENQPVHTTAGLGGQAAVAQPRAQLSHRILSQPDVLRRAQAAFSDLRGANGRRQAQGVF